MLRDQKPCYTPCVDCGIKSQGKRCRACHFALRAANKRGPGRGHPLGEVYRSMVRRCYEPTCSGFRHYGGRGIRVCRTWRASFTRWLSDMGPRPTSKHQIDRKNNSKSYSPGNCRWATPKEQARNKRTNRQLTLNGKTMCLSAWVERLGVSGATVLGRLKRGWSAERALTTPIRIRSTAPCSNCSAATGYHCRGRCKACATYWERNRVERPERLYRRAS